MIPRTEADRMISRIHARKRRGLALLCLGIGVGVSEVGLVTWAIREGGLDGISLIPIGVVPAGFLGVAFGALAILVVPGALARKHPSSAVGVFWLTCLWTAIATLITGWFPFCTAGVALCAVTLYLAIRMPDEQLVWTTQKCIGCSYDVSANPAKSCPECGLSETDLTTAPLPSAIGNTRLAVALWVFFMLAFWAVGAGLCIALELE